VAKKLVEHGHLSIRLWKDTCILRYLVRYDSDQIGRGMRPLRRVSPSRASSRLTQRWKRMAHHISPRQCSMSDTGVYVQRFKSATEVVLTQEFAVQVSSSRNSSAGERPAGEKKRWERGGTAVACGRDNTDRATFGSAQSVVQNG